MPPRPGLSAALTLSIDLDDKHIYTTMERIPGKVNIEVSTDTLFEAVEIELLGMAKTSGRRVVAQSPCARTAKTSHRFLKLKQPDIHLHCPGDGTFRAGSSYSIPFEFAIPERTLPTSCCHASTSPALFEAHTLTPPSFGDQSFGEVTDFAPRGISVRYRVIARVRSRVEDSPDPPSGVTAELFKRIRFLPNSLSNAFSVQESNQQSDNIRQLAIRKSWIKPCGRILLGSVKASGLHAIITNESHGDFHVGKATGEVAICLYFHPFGNDVLAPSEVSLRGYLRPTTCASVCSIPQPPSSALWSNPEADFHKAPAINLIAQSIRGIQWIPNPSGGLGALEACPECTAAAQSTSRQSDYLDESQSVFCYRAEFLVPIDNTLQFPLVPTFSSCLVSRNYNLDLRLSVPGPPLRPASSIRFGLPVQVVNSGRAQHFRPAEGWHVAAAPSEHMLPQQYGALEEHAAADLLNLEGYLDAPPCYESLVRNFGRP